MNRLALVVAGISLAGCTVSAEPAPVISTEPALPPVTTGTLVVHWTIDGRTDPNACVQSLSAQVEISVFDPGGNEVGAWRQDCGVFSTSIPLNAGGYDASGTLLDAAGQPRTTTVAIDPFNLRGNETFDVAVDFPASSFR